ncbi:hypothetical protein MPRG_11840 [Mycobacterium paragordonae]|uniref:Uncharacterized protein n=1 Tax=Mycobacterium paragordonae TaxID=1389713 RepID=A0ABQ1C0F4_9MYCO|nr:hypothetical protein MPRG_11840 [Mycobacterium paragordonae]
MTTGIKIKAGTVATRNPAIKLRFAALTRPTEALLVGRDPAPALLRLGQPAQGQLLSRIGVLGHGVNQLAQRVHHKFLREHKILRFRHT